MGEFVSDEVLLNDITNTVIEHAAYVNIYQGYKALSELPENEGMKAMEYSGLYHKFLSLSHECYQFLLRLQSIKAERGL